MSYKVNEIFLSVQAEGRNTGRLAVFVRLSGCNLKCPFCDTEHEPFTEMTGEEINTEINRLAPDMETLVIFTGGEPTLQLKDTEELAAGHPRAMESNGTGKLPAWWTENDWLTISPKTKLALEDYRAAKEVKVLFGYFHPDYVQILAENLQCELYLQPIERGGKFDVRPIIEYMEKHPAWKLSVQWHKLTGTR